MFFCLCIDYTDVACKNTVSDKGIYCHLLYFDKLKFPNVWKNWSRKFRPIWIKEHTNSFKQSQDNLSLFISVKVFKCELSNQYMISTFFSDMSFWRMSYTVTTNSQSPVSTARNTRALPISYLQKNVKVTNKLNAQYQIVDRNDHTLIQKSKTFGIVLSQRVFENDLAQVLKVVTEAVAAELDGEMCFFFLYQIHVKFNWIL